MLSFELLEMRRIKQDQLKSGTEHKVFFSSALMGGTAAPQSVDSKLVHTSIGRNYKVNYDWKILCPDVLTDDYVYTSFPCQYRQKADFINPFETTMLIAEDAYTSTNETANSTTCLHPYEA